MDPKNTNDNIPRSFLGESCFPASRSTLKARVLLKLRDGVTDWKMRRKVLRPSYRDLIHAKKFEFHDGPQTPLPSKNLKILIDPQGHESLLTEFFFIGKIVSHVFEKIQDLK